ncbi:uncharacterized protein SAPINGB_P006263 [Magnusiomyces paraingens]|uniref:RING-type domain-containing protein n=1 Tax=Magnusiomyces paraingens TaxID=2606893 RepID=A0A5E8CB58_9ASCO|nr:uncharacterized protein SAPINGB_P006263 [Saprochaete ingens]VVT58546.1 unnamed protein product [Saprochaete ingens]
MNTLIHQNFESEPIILNRRTITNFFKKSSPRNLLRRNASSSSSPSASSSSSSASPSTALTDNNISSSSTPQIPRISMPEPVSAFDAMMRNYRANDDCLTINELNIIFPRVPYGSLVWAPGNMLRKPRPQHNHSKHNHPSYLCDSPTPEKCTCPIDHACAICLNVFACGDVVRVLPCHHLLHSECLDPWFTSVRAECPLCKRGYRENADRLRALFQELRLTR